MILIKKEREPRNSKGVLYIRVYDTYAHSLEKGDYQYILSNSSWYENEEGDNPNSFRQ